MEILQPAGWPAPRGYSNGVAVRGRQVYVAGMVGWDAQCRFQTDDFVGQVRQALQNIVVVLAQAGAKPEHITRMTWYVTSKREYVLVYDLGGGTFDASLIHMEGKANEVITSNGISRLGGDHFDEAIARLVLSMYISRVADLGATSR